MRHVAGVFLDDGCHLGETMNNVFTRLCRAELAQVIQDVINERAASE